MTRDELIEALKAKGVEDVEVHDTARELYVVPLCGVATMKQALDELGVSYDASLNFVVPKGAALKQSQIEVEALAKALYEDHLPSCAWEDTLVWVAESWRAKAERVLKAMR